MNADILKKWFENALIRAFRARLPVLGVFPRARLPCILGLFGRPCPILETLQQISRLN
jgi:hypothetical protein